MRIAFVTPHAPDDPYEYSGTTLRMRRAFERAGADVVPVGPLAERGRRGGQALKLAYRLARREYERFRSPVLLRGYARQIVQAMRDTGADVAFGASSLPFAFTPEIPYGYWVDATFEGFRALYPQARPFAQRALHNGYTTDRAALQGARLAVYSSRWAADSAIHDLGGDPERVTVIPYGANLDDPPSAPDVAASVAARRLGDRERIELLFVGTDAHRKGADIALAAASEIEARGRAVRLTFIGTAPPGLSLPAFACVSGYMDTATVAGRTALAERYASAHALVLPTRADCTPIVVAEAYAYGVPAITSDVGGLPSMVSAESGALVPSGCSPSAYADALLALVDDGDAYRRRAFAARRRYETEFNWDTGARSVLDRLERALSMPPAQTHTRAHG